MCIEIVVYVFVLGLFLLWGFVAAAGRLPGYIVCHTWHANRAPAKDFGGQREGLDDHTQPDDGLVLKGLDM